MDWIFNLPPHPNQLWVHTFSYPWLPGAFSPLVQQFEHKFIYLFMVFLKALPIAKNIL
jgi:hypothetical protein